MPTAPSDSTAEFCQQVAVIIPALDESECQPVRLNYAFGLTRVEFLHYLLASWIAMLPGTLLHVYLGSLARAGARGGEKSPLEWAMHGVGLLATLAVTIFITKAARKAMQEKGFTTPATGNQPLD